MTFFITAIICVVVPAVLAVAYNVVVNIDNTEDKAKARRA